jgi:hypothetical protein
VKPIMKKDERPIQYPTDLHPWALEPYYNRHIGAMTSEGLYSKADIAEQLAWRDKTIATLSDIIHRSLNCGQLEKLESARAVIAAYEAKTWYGGWPDKL